MNGLPPISWAQSTIPNPASAFPLSLQSLTSKGSKLSLPFVPWTVQSTNPLSPRYFLSFVSNVKILLCKSAVKSELSSFMFVCSMLLGADASSIGARLQETSMAIAGMQASSFTVLMFLSLTRIYVLMKYDELSPGFR